MDHNRDDAKSEKVGLSRRSLMIKASVAGAAAWTAPALVESVLWPAAAASGAPRGEGADYRFQGTFNDTNGNAGPLTLDAPAGNFATETVDGSGREVFDYALDDGPRFATSFFTNQGIYSVAILYRPDFVSGFRKILDFKNLTSDNGFYVLNGSLNFYPVTTGPSGTISSASYQQVAITRDAAGTVVGYVDGLQQFSFNDSASQYGVMAETFLRFFDDDDNTGDGEQSSGGVARIRVFDRALSASEVAALEVNRDAP